MSKTVLSAAAAILLGSSAQAAPNLIQNGSFETPTGYFTTYNAGSSALTGWTITTNSVDVASNAIYSSTTYAVDGTQWLDLVGTGIGGALQQSFATTAGQSYTLSFSYANNPDFQSESGLVNVAGTTMLLSDAVTHTGSTRVSGLWTSFTETFKADGPTATLAFADTSGRYGAGIYLDAISVTAAAAPVTDVPEPASLSILCLGIAGAAFARRRRFS